MSDNNPYGELASTENNNTKTTTQTVSTTNMVFGESNPDYDNDHKAAGCCACSPMVSSILYGVILMGGAVVALLAKHLSQYVKNKYRGFCEFGPSTITKQICVENQTVYRVCFVLTVFFLFCAGVTAFHRHYHYTSWISKISLIATIYGLSSWLVPAQVFASYREAARWCSAVFIIMQVFVLVDFAHNLHENLGKYMTEDGEENDDNSVRAKALYLALSILSLILMVVGIVCLYALFAPCALHTGLITVTTILSVISLIISVLGAVNKGILPPMIIGMYCVLMTYQALVVNPDKQCQSQWFNPEEQMPTWLLVLSLGFMVLQIGYTSIRAASNTATFVDSSITHTTTTTRNSALTSDPYQYDVGYQEQEHEKKHNYSSLDNARSSGGSDEQEEVSPPKHWLFHLVMAFASMYMAMILTNWGNDMGASMNNSEASLHSFWIKIVAVWLSYAVYIWTLIAPLVFPDRDFN